jgi:PAS domain S-box-containing protein
MSNAKILIVEDEKIVAKDIHNRLRSFGYEVTAIVSTGEEAIQKAIETKPDLALLDIRLHGETDGVLVAEQIRDRLHIPVVYLTAYADAETLRRAKLTEPFGYLVKPFGERELHSTIEIALHRHAMERRLQESEQWLRTTLMSIGDGVIAVDVEERVRSINHVAAELTGWPEEEAVSWPVSEVFNIINEDRTPVEDMPVTKAIREGVFTGNIKFILITKTGLEIPVEDGAAPIRDEKGQITGAVVVFRDIREQRRHEEERERSLAREQAMRAEAERLLRLKDEFLATLSHELRTPLHMISGWTQHLQRDNLDADGTARALENIQRNIYAQTQIIDDLLDVSAIIMGKLRLSMQIVDADDCLREALGAVRPTAEAKGIELEYLPDPGAAFVMADPARLQQIAWNLLSNAIKFTDRGGRVKLRLRENGGQIAISVSDTGCGIAPEFLPHVFDRFSQADSSIRRTQGGLGLGLAIVRYLTEMHGGVVKAESAGAGRGATFTVWLPAATNPREAESGGRYSSLGHDAILKGLKLLIVDDDVEACQLFEVMLSQCGAQVTCLNSGSEALACLESERPDLLILDIAMPGLDGYELLARVRARGINIPAIALTAYARTADRVRALAAGFQSHVSKPVEADELVMAAASLCGRLNQAPRG